jgi:triose/dihydroxyacetone kinase / FAD-AMP lyase (cyclizing)
MPGFSVTLLLLPTDSEVTTYPADMLLALLDDDCAAPGWKWHSHTALAHTLGDDSRPSQFGQPENKISSSTKLVALDPDDFVTRIERACSAVIAAESEITKLDTVVGDGLFWFRQASTSTYTLYFISRGLRHYPRGGYVLEP